MDSDFFYSAFLNLPPPAPVMITTFPSKRISLVIFKKKRIKKIRRKRKKKKIKKETIENNLYKSQKKKNNEESNPFTCKCGGEREKGGHR